MPKKERALIENKIKMNSKKSQKHMKIKSNHMIIIPGKDQKHLNEENGCEMIRIMKRLVKDIKERKERDMNRK